jgi:hypothetical protein
MNRDLAQALHLALTAFRVVARIRHAENIAPRALRRHQPEPNG